MTAYPPPQRPRRLERSRSDRMLGGVCGGLATYLNMDPTLVRLLTVAIGALTGVPILLYLVALVIIPQEPKPPVEEQRRPVGPPQQWGYGPGGGYPSSDPVWGPEGAPWEQREPWRNAGPPASGPTDRPGPAVDPRP